MGAWGFGIRQDDFVCDVIGVFEDLLKAGASIADATQAVKSRFAAAQGDSDDGPLFWIALADMQWTYGGVDTSVLQRVKGDFDAGRSLRAWEEDPRGLARRRMALEKFIRKIASQNQRPKKPPKTVIRAPKFHPGDCLSIRLAGGQYAAALVLAADHSVPEYGKNLVAVLNYFSTDRPTMAVFRERTWLDIAWYQPIGFRTVKARIDIAGHIEILESDPKESNVYRRWTGIGEHAQHHSDRTAKS